MAEEAKRTVKVSMIAAIDRNGVIGTGKGGIPWHLPKDSQHFRNYTQRKAMLLGRTTYEEMEGWFTTQIPLVLSRKRNLSLSDDAILVNSVEEAISKTKDLGMSELVISGGAMVYRLGLDFADELILTKIEAEVSGTATFPDYEKWGPWEETKIADVPSDADHLYSFRIVRLSRR